MTTLHLLVDLLLITPRLAWAWLKTKLPSRHVTLRSRHCPLCGWSFWWEPGTPVVCGSSCEAKRQALSAITLFCCDMDLEYQRSSYSAGAGHYQSTRVYRCPVCGRIWLYIVEWHKDSGSEADWYPQWTEAERAAPAPPDLFDERTRTKVYEVKS
jgi:hypothetical protein